MEPHPVPQNVTSFEFHLVGDMTLKQFGYLASGLVIAYLTFVLVFPLSPIIAIPIIAFSSLFGAALAFMPILDRPLGHWIKAYFQAIFSPTQAVWKPSVFNTKMNIQDPEFKNRLQLYISSLSFAPTNPLPLTPATKPAIRPIPASLKPAPKDTPVEKDVPVSGPATPTVPASPYALPLDEELTTIVDMAKQAQTMQAKIIELENEINWLKTHPQNSLSAALLSTPVIPPSQINLKKDANVKIVAAPIQKKTQLSLTSLPNIINGIVTDAKGNYLEGVIAITHNKDGLPVRALKTNKLGQFTGATPLLDGLYTVTLEKDGLEFDTLQINLDGTVLPPLMIVAKPQEANHG